jgi:hypothetical protein
VQVTDGTNVIVTLQNTQLSALTAADFTFA